MVLERKRIVNEKKKSPQPRLAVDVCHRCVCCLPILLFLLLSSGYAEYADGVPDGLRVVQKQAENLNLHQHSAWLYLLHYYPAVPGGHSDITDRRFFLAENGMTDPGAELSRTLEAIFDPAVDKGNRHGQCLFRSRFEWLDSQLKFDRRRLPDVNCRDYNAWRKLIAAQSISLVFASAFMDNPGSVYGHTFLKINREKGGRRLNLLDHVIQYQALPEDEPGLLYVFKGVFGGYRGFYPLDPYYIPIQNNIEYEDRSIWEYELNLAPEEMERLLTHSWEMAHFYTGYYFFKQNCAYRILELIEIAAPQHRFKDRFVFWAMPSQAVVHVLNEKGLVGQVNYFPARTRQLMQKFASLAPVEQGFLKELLREPELLESERFIGLTADQQTRILETAMDFLRSRVNKNRDEPENKAFRSRILLARSKLGKAVPFAAPLIAEQPIHLGHAPARIQVAGGRTDSVSFTELGLRPSYHDLLAADIGHLQNSHFTTFDVYFRLTASGWTLHQLEIVQLFDLAPNLALSDDWSWRFKLGLYPATLEPCADCRKSQVQVAFGKSRFLFSMAGSAFLMAHGSLESDSRYESGAMLGAGLDAGLLLQITEDWKMLVAVSGTRGMAGDDHAWVRSSLEQSWKLGQHQDLRLHWIHQAEHEVKLAVNWYF